MMRIYLINAIILVSIVLAAFFFDRSLQLGNFHGLVFGLYTLYASILQVIVNVAFGFWRKKKEHYITAGILTTIILLIVVGLELFV